MSAIAIITARGGSKRIPGKNIKEFCGKPIIEYSIKAALDSGIFDEIMVSTDDKKIAKIAEKCGANVPFLRSSEAANDYATTAEVLEEVLRKYREIKKEFVYGCCIYPTAPFITAEKLRRGMELLKKSPHTTVMPVVPFSFPPQRGIVIRNGELEMKWPENTYKRSQDLDIIYHDCGQFYGFYIKDFLESGKILNQHNIPIVMSELEVQDIDNEVDWKLAEMKYQLMIEKGENKC